MYYNIISILIKTWVYINFIIQTSINLNFEKLKIKIIRELVNTLTWVFKKDFTYIIEKQNQNYNSNNQIQWTLAFRLKSLKLKVKLCSPARVRGWKRKAVRGREW